MPGISSSLSFMTRETDLEHLNEGYTETEVGVVGQNQRSRKEGTNG
jgi:hypothetical protein